MEIAVKKYLATIGARGGRQSRRTLLPSTAKTMVAVREARRAYRRFHAQCFWSYDPKLLIKAHDIPWVAEQLFRHGNRTAWQYAIRLCPSLHSRQT